MAEFSGRWTTSGTPIGHQQVSYNQAQDAIMEKSYTACLGFEGVATNYLNSLAGTVTGANTVSINTGGAVVDGKAYNNSAAVSVNIPSSVGGGNTRIDRIVLRCSWAGFTVLITRIAGTDAGSPTVPSIVQTPGTTYDIPLYKATVNTAGTVTLIDERTLAQVQNAGLVDGIITTQKVTDYAINGSKIADGSVSINKIVDGSVNAAKIIDGSVTTSKIADLNVTTGKIADSAVTAAKIANRTRKIFIPVSKTYELGSLYSSNSGMQHGKVMESVGDFRVPSDYVSNGIIKTVFAVPCSDFFPGNVCLSQVGYSFAIGTLSGLSTLLYDTSLFTVPATHTYPVSEDVVVVNITTNIAVDTFVHTVLTRFGTSGSDTCVGDFEITGWTFEYTADS